MHRISSDKDYYSDGKIVIDADGIPLEPASKDYVAQRVPVSLFTGTGSPEGKVEAPVGSIYTDTAATNGAIRWIKTSGAGSTGWRVEYGDTGWRDISASIDTNTLDIESGGHVRIRRTERFLEYSFKSVKVKQTGNIYLPPSGFRPPYGENANAYQSGFFTVSTAWMGIFGMQANATLGPNREFILRINAEDNWPTTLPGTPA